MQSVHGLYALQTVKFSTEFFLTTTFKYNLSMKPIYVGLLGLGTVGTGTLKVLSRNADEIARRAGREIIVKRVAVKDLNKQRSLEGNSVEITNHPGDVINDPEISIVVELIGGETPVYGYVVDALNKGKHVVTANKELIAIRGNELFQLAQEHSVVIAFEAAVGGGISIIKALREGLAGNRIQSLVGIINGTSNYILSGIKEKQCSFSQMLQEAQQLGYAEADPEFDIEGIDAAHKLTILAAVAFGIPLRLDGVYREGISHISSEDMQYAEELGFEIKPMAITRCNDAGVEMRVHPCLVPQKRLIANVNGVMNAILVTGDAVGQTLHYGAGAGSEPTASAVVADLVDVVRTLTTDPGNRVPHLAFQPNQLSDLPMVPMNQICTPYYIRMNAVNRAGVLAEITRILGDLEISIESVIQKGSGEYESVLPIIMITQKTVEENMNRALEQIRKYEMVVGEINRIRIEPID